MSFIFLLEQLILQCSYYMQCHMTFIQCSNVIERIQQHMGFVPVMFAA